MRILQTDKRNGTNSRQYIMLHHTAIGTDKNGATAARYLSGPITQGGRVSCHYVVGLNGSVWKIGEETDRLWHAWNGDGDFSSIDGNSKAIGIEIDSNWYEFTKCQFDAVADLVCDIAYRNGITTDKIIRHADYTSRKWDVGPEFFRTGKVGDLQWFQNLIESKLSLKMDDTDYKKIFDKEFPEGSTVFQDVNTLVNKIGTQEAYALLIGLERVKKYGDRHNTGV